MILKKLLGKTVETAKQSAQQMYGEYIPEISTVLAKSEKEEGSNKEHLNHKNTPKSDIKGVRFERSNKVITETLAPKPRSNMHSIREYAAEQASIDINDLQKPEPSKGHQEAPPKTDKHTDHPPNGKNHNTKQYYSRANIRSKGSISNGIEKFSSDEGVKNRGPADEFIENLLSSEFHKQKMQPEKPSTSDKNTSDRQEKGNWHHRFDKLESLLHSVVLPSNLEYTSHPAFQKLERTGIQKSVITNWFNDIINKGIEPYRHTELFMSELSAMIRNGLGSRVTEKPKQFLLFAGPSGSGKTQLIMNLSKHPDFMLHKKVAVVSVLPIVEEDDPYFTILSPFCQHNDIPYYKIKDSEDIDRLQDEWLQFDHVLIDTPSFASTSSDRYQYIQEALATISTVETHWLLNATTNSFAKQENYLMLKEQMETDYLAITHLDRTSQWGPIIPLLQESEWSLRYINLGNSVPAGLRPYVPKSFTKQMLANT